MIVGNNVDCGLNRLGTGYLDCFQKLGKPVGFIDMPTDFSLNRLTDTLDETYFQDQIKAGTFYPFLGAVDFAENNEDDVTETFSSGIIVDVRDGLPMFDFTYVSGGYAQHKAFYTHNGFGNGTIALVFENNVIAFALNTDGVTIEGLKRGRLKTKTFMNNTGSTVSRTMISVQLTDTFQYNTAMYLINAEQLGFSIIDYRGAIDSAITVVGTPAVGDTSIVVQVRAACNTAINVAGLLATDFDVTGQAVSAIAYDATTELYTLTVDALVAGTKIVSLGGGTDVAAEVAGTFYSGSSAEFTV